MYEESRSTDTDTNISLMLKISDKDFKAVIIEIIQQTVSKTQVKKMESFSKEIEDMKKDQMKILQMKNKIIKIRSSMMGSAEEWKGQRKEFINSKTVQ